MTMSAMHASSGPPRPHHVLLVDDSDAVRALYRRLLEVEGYRVSVAPDGPSALASMEEDAPDLILLDHQMPGMSGAEVLHRIRQHPALATVPTVFLTASALEVEEAFDLGATDYFTKPIDRRMLAARVRALIASHSHERTLRQARVLAAEHEHLIHEIRCARSVQRAQLPVLPHVWDDYAVTGAIVPCNDLGGDTFDILRGPTGELTLAVVDVSGHGFASAMVASRIQGMLKLLVHDLAPRAALAELNRLLTKDTDEHYACVALVTIAGAKVRVINAGLPPVLVLSGGAIVWQAEGSGFPPGLLPEGAYDEMELSFEPGMRLLIASDGLADPFGSSGDAPRFVEKLDLADPRRPLGRATPSSLSTRMLALFGDAGLAQEDDATLVLLERRLAHP
ncbi:MAG: SpoIIE family protein phosphatase [Byssovorax sp.]